MTGVIAAAPVGSAPGRTAAGSLPDRSGRHRGQVPDVLILPLPPGLQFPPAAPGQRVRVGPLVALALLDETLLGEAVEVG